jgi:hypothetical protein
MPNVFGVYWGVSIRLLFQEHPGADRTLATELQSFFWLNKFE